MFTDNNLAICVLVLSDLKSSASSSLEKSIQMYLYTSLRKYCQGNNKSTPTGFSISVSKQLVYKNFVNKMLVCGTDSKTSIYIPVVPSQSNL